MTSFIIRRALQALVLIKCVLIFVFLLLHISGDPISVMLPEEATKEEEALLRQQYGFDKPLIVQYGMFFSKVLRGSFGDSFETEEPALGLVLSHMPATIELAGTAFIVSILIGLPLGCFAALKEHSILDRVCMIGAVLGQALPGFWLGLILILVFAVNLRWLPSFGYGNWSHLVMPGIAASVFHTARLARLMRSEMLEVLRANYITTARSKGLVERVVLFRHAMKNSAIPIVTVLGLDLALTLGGTVIIETVFAWPGVGRLTVEAINTRDFPVVQAAVFVLASTFVFINMIVDIIYTFLDPRIKFE